MNGQQLESWTSVGGALDMKIYSMDDRDTPLDLAVTKTNDVQKNGMTGAIVDTLDKVRHGWIVDMRSRVALLR